MMSLSRYLIRLSSLGLTVGHHLLIGAVRLSVAVGLLVTGWLFGLVLS